MNRKVSDTASDKAERKKTQEVQRPHVGGQRRPCLPRARTADPTRPVAKEASVRWAGILLEFF